jgi:hypothetical protein
MYIADPKRIATGSQQTRFSRMTGTKRKSAAQLRDGAKRAKAGTENAAATDPGIPENTPLATLLNALEFHQKNVASKKGNVVHWFRSDLRLEDNRALDSASRKARENGKALIALYIVSPQVMSSFDASHREGLEIS